MAVKIENKIVDSLERISQAFRVLLWNQSKEYQLSPIQIRILVFLSNCAEQNSDISRLSKEFDLSKATISDSVKALKRKKLIDRIQMKSDARAYLIKLTSEGNDLAIKCGRFNDSLLESVKLLPEENHEYLYTNLLGILQYLNKSGVISTQRMCSTCHYFSIDTKGPQYFCKLMNQPLLVKELRIDCPEHLNK